MSSIAKLIAGIGLNTDEFSRGIANVKGQTASTESSFSSLKSAIAGAFSVGAVVSFTRSIGEYAARVKEASDATGASTTAIQTLNAVAADNSSGAEKMAAGLDKIRVAQIDALDGGEKMAAAFERLGISMADIEGVGADRVFELIGKSIVNSENQTQALAAASDILGNKLFNNLLPSLKAVGIEGLDALNAKMTESGRIMDADMIAKIDLLGDKWDAFKTRVLVFAADLANYLERLGAGIGSALSLDPLDNFSRGWNEMSLLQQEASRKAVEAAKAGNAEIVSSEKNKVADVHRLAVEQSVTIEQIQAEARARNAEEEAKDAERREREMQASMDRMRTARDKYYKAASDAIWDALSPEEKLNQLYELRNGLLESIYMQVANGNEQTEEYYLLELKLLEVSGEIERATRKTGKTQRDESERAKNFTNDQVNALSGLQTLLKNMTDKELADFIEKIKLLHKEVGALDFSGLIGLQAINGLSIPNESVQNAEQFGKALLAMATAMAGLKLPDLAGLEVLKGFKIPNESVLNARQFGRAIAEMVDALNNEPLDLQPIQKVADLFNALKGGTIQIQIAPPTRDQLTLTVDEGFKSDMSSLAQSAATIAKLQGVIFQ